MIPVSTLDMFMSGKECRLYPKSTHRLGDTACANQVCEVWVLKLLDRWSEVSRASRGSFDWAIFGRWYSRRKKVI